MKDWLTDLGRTAWGLLGWNLRKAWFRLRGARGRAPCQHPSDSGAAHVTGCEAVIGWAQPARFRRVCPLLERGADGRWCCSVAAADVRPFWGRALAIGGTATVVTYVGGVLALFGLLRARGYALGLGHVVWPPALWRELPRAQAEVFLKQARADYAAGRASEAVLALRSAWQSDPANHAVGMLLAQFAQGADPRGAERIYAHLRAARPDKRAETARAWLYALLTHGDFAGMTRLAGEELAAAPEAETAAWLHALIFACRQTHDAAPLEALAAAPDGLAPAWRELAATEAAALRGTLAGEALRARLLTSPPEDAPAYTRFWQVGRLAAGGWPQDATAALRAAGTRLAGRDTAALLLEILAAAGDDAARAAEIQKFLAARARLNDAELELLCAHLIRHPLPGPARALAAAWRRDTPGPDTARMPWALAIFSVAAANGDEASQRDLGEWLRQAGGGQLPVTLGAFAQILSSNQERQYLPRVLPTLPSLPLEVVYSLFSNAL
jgi:hypothetical protein